MASWMEVLKAAVVEAVDRGDIPYRIARRARVGVDVVKRLLDGKDIKFSQAEQIGVLFNFRFSRASIKQLASIKERSRRAARLRTLKQIEQLRSYLQELENDEANGRSA